MFTKGFLFMRGLLFGKCDPPPTPADPPPTPAGTDAPAAAGFGANVNLTGRPIGGGPGYGDWQTAPDGGGIRTLADLQQALADAMTAAQHALADGTAITPRLIYVADDAVIDTGDAVLSVAPGVTIASGRGRDGSLGGLVRALSDGKNTMFAVTDATTLGATTPLAPVRFTGLRMQGPDPSEKAPDCFSWGRFAVHALEPGSRADSAKIVPRSIEIDNNEIYAWTIATSFEGVRGTTVHHNHFHHNRRNAQGSIVCDLQLEIHSSGYGVDSNSGHTLIEANLFDHNRHAVASHGDILTVYEAYYNVVLGPNVSHSFDVHGGIDRDDGTYIAGNTLIIAFNSLLDTNNDAVNVRGLPVTGAWVFHNEVAGGIDTIMQTKVPIECQGLDCDFVHNRMQVFDNQAHASATPSWLVIPPQSDPANPLGGVP